MSHKKLRPIIVKVSVLGYFPLLTFTLLMMEYSDGHDHDFSRSPIVDHFLTIVDLFTRSFFNDRRSSIV